MKHKTLFVLGQIMALVIVGVVVTLIAITASGSSKYISHSNHSVNAPVILESAKPSIATSSTPTQDSAPEVDPITSNPRYGKTNEDSPLYQQCLAELEAMRAGLVNLQNLDSQYNAEYNDLIVRYQSATDPTEADALSQSASLKMQQIQSTHIAISDYENQHPHNWGCGWSGKFYF